MSDSEPDLYSFLRSKDIPDPDASSEDGGDGASENAPADVRAVDSFDDADAPDDSSAADSFSYQFNEEGLGEALRDMPAEALNDAPFGIVRVDDDGVVEFYNEYESNLSGVDPDDAEGRNFFTELAPCSNNRIFQGRFKKGMRHGELDERFTYTFTYKMKPTLVDVHMYRDETGQNWIMIRKR